MLSAILANSGANFDMKPLEEWDRRSGALEHHYIHESYKWFSRAKKIRSSVIPQIFGYKFCIGKSNSYIQKLFDKADFAKSSKLIWMVKRIADHLDYQVRIIGVYRNFSDYLVSRYRKFGGSYNKWRSYWENVNYTLLLQSRIYKSVLIGYEEMVDFAQKEWAENLAFLTGLSKAKILEQRKKIVNQKLAQREPRSLFENPDTRKLYETLRNNKDFNFIDEKKT